jgi:uncharacterized protein (DUF1786 family)
MGYSRNAKVKIKATKRRLEALRLREKGLTYEAMGKEMGVSPERAWALTSEAFDWLRQRLEDKASDVMKLELRRLDALHRAYYAKARRGDTKAADMVVKVMDRRISLLGLAVQKHEVKVDQTYEVNVSAKIDEYAAELGRQLESRSPAVPSHVEGDGCREPLDQA